MSALTAFSNSRPLLQHPCPLADGQPDARPVLDRFGKSLARLVEIVAGPQHAIDFAGVLGPLLDLVIIAMVRHERFVGFIVRLGTWHG
jgi:hypothetical protein